MANERVDDDQLPGETDLSRRWTGLAADVRRRLGPGAPLDASARTAFEGRLGGDLSGAMVHRTMLAGYLARTLGATALSAGQHVLGDEATLDPSTPSGAAVLGHELTHVVHRDVDDAGEVEARLVEREVVMHDETAAGSPAEASLDVDDLTERVYQRLLAQVRNEHDRAAWIG